MAKAKVAEKVETPVSKKSPIRLRGRAVARQTPPKTPRRATKGKNENKPTVKEAPSTPVQKTDSFMFSDNQSGKKGKQNGSVTPENKKTRPVSPSKNGLKQEANVSTTETPSAKKQPETPLTPGGLSKSQKKRLRKQQKQSGNVESPAKTDSNRNRSVSPKKASSKNEETPVKAAVIQTSVKKSAKSDKKVKNANKSAVNPEKKVESASKLQGGKANSVTPMKSSSKTDEKTPRQQDSAQKSEDGLSKNKKKRNRRKSKQSESSDATLSSDLKGSRSVSPSKSSVKIDEKKLNANTGSPKKAGFVKNSPEKPVSGDKKDVGLSKKQKKQMQKNSNQDVAPQKRVSIADLPVDLPSDSEDSSEPEESENVLSEIMLSLTPKDMRALEKLSDDDEQLKFLLKRCPEEKRAQLKEDWENEELDSDDDEVLAETAELLDSIWKTMSKKEVKEFEESDKDKQLEFILSKCPEEKKEQVKKMFNSAPDSDDDELLDAEEIESNILERMSKQEQKQYKQLDDSEQKKVLLLKHANDLEKQCIEASGLFDEDDESDDGGEIMEKLLAKLHEKDSHKFQNASWEEQLKMLQDVATEEEKVLLQKLTEGDDDVEMDFDEDSDDEAATDEDSGEESDDEASEDDDDTDWLDQFPPEAKEIAERINKRAAKEGKDLLKLPPMEALTEIIKYATDEEKKKIAFGIGEEESDDEDEPSLSDEESDISGNLEEKIKPKKELVKEEVEKVKSEAKKRVDKLEKVTSNEMAKELGPIRFSKDEQEKLVKECEKRTESQQMRMLYVGSLPVGITATDVKELLPASSAVNIFCSKWMEGKKEREGKEGASYAFVEFLDEDATKKAHEKLKQTPIKGKELVVDFCGKGKSNGKNKPDQNENCTLDPLKLYVTGLKPKQKLSDVEKAFPKASRVMFPRSRGKHNRSKTASHCYIAFANRFDAMKAFNTMHGTVIDGSRLTVVFAKTPKESEKKKQRRVELEKQYSKKSGDVGEDGSTKKRKRSRRGKNAKKQKMEEEAGKGKQTDAGTKAADSLKKAGINVDELSDSGDDSDGGKDNGNINFSDDDSDGEE